MPSQTGSTIYKFMNPLENFFENPQALWISIGSVSPLATRTVSRIKKEDTVLWTVKTHVHLDMWVKDKITRTSFALVWDPQWF